MQFSPDRHHNWLANHIIRFCDAIVEHCFNTWNKLTDQAWLTMSMGLRILARRF